MEKGGEKASSKTLKKAKTAKYQIKGRHFLPKTSQVYPLVEVAWILLQQSNWHIMKPFRTLRTLTIFPSKPRNSNSHLLDRVLLSHFFSAQPEQNDSENDNNDAVFDSSHFAVPNIDTKTTPQDATWDEKYRKRADRLVFGHETQKSKFKILQEQEEEERRRVLAKALLRAALERPDDEDDEDVVKEEDQKSLSVGIVGAPNAGKSALTNYMVCVYFFFGFLVYCQCLIYWFSLTNFEFCYLEGSVLTLDCIK